MIIIVFVFVAVTVNKVLKFDQCNNIYELSYFLC